MIKGIGKAYRRAKQLRREMTLPEVLLWQQLRRNQTGFHWRKQHPAGPYDLDFYCDKAKLCVEVDGEAHERGNQPSKDAVRDDFLARHGVMTLRISAVDVLKNLEGVVLHITQTAMQRTPDSSPSLPRGGGSPQDWRRGREQSERLPPPEPFRRLRRRPLHHPPEEAGGPPPRSGED